VATPSDASTTLDPHPMAGETEFLHEEGPVVVAPAPAPNHAAQGVAYALIAYSTWGTAIPIYMWGMSNRWAAATAIELLLHRIAWGLAAMALLLTVRRRWPSLVGIVRSWSSFRVLIATTVLIAINWFTFTWSVVNGAAAEVALGYYINPLVSIAMGMVFLGERMRPVQWWCIGIAIAGVALQAVAIGRLPYLALIVAGSFGTYGLLRKRAKADADVGLTVEMGLTFTPMMFVNGVQVRGYRAPNVLTRAVDELARQNPPRMTAAADVPPPAFDKLVGDWDAERRTLDFGTDVFVAREGEATAPIRILAFYGYGHEMAAKLDGHIREAIAGRDDVSYTIRSYALGADCNPHVSADINPDSCTMHQAVEAVGMLHGPDAAMRMHAWVMEHQASFSEPAMESAIREMGWDVDAVMEKMGSPEVARAIEEDASFLKKIRKPSYALLVVNEKIAPRWVLEDLNLVRGILDLVDEQASAN